MSSSSSSAVADLFPRSIPLILARREEGRLLFPLPSYNGSNKVVSHSFVKSVTRQFSPRCLVQSPLLVTPQTTNIFSSTTNRTPAITSLHVDRVEHRFVLAGGSDAIVSVYDLSKWGSEDFLEHQQQQQLQQQPNKYNAPNRIPKRSVHKPIASSQREPPRRQSTLFSYDNNADRSTVAIDIPSGHSSPITKVQWYPVDSGAFLSSSKDGSLLVWDTTSMSPVAQCTPFVDPNTRIPKGVATFHLSPMRIHSAVVASLHDPSLKLVDIRSGASSHTLLGHAAPGISSVTWAPHCDVVLASGGLDGTVRLWDIRKAGSRACVAILNQDVTHPTTTVARKPYHADYSHLPKPSAAIVSHVNDHSYNPPYRHATAKQTKKNKFSMVVSTQQVAPNNYRPTENSSIMSHNGPVTALSFGANQDGHYLVSVGASGSGSGSGSGGTTLHVWDLRGNGHLIPLRFLTPSGLVSHQQQSQPQHTIVPMMVTPFSRFATGGSSLSSPLGACWMANGSNLLAYALEKGGMPQQVLQGHLHTITAMDAIEGTMQILTGARDGMILTWGVNRGVSDNQHHRHHHGSGGWNRKRNVDQDSW